jgi:branched-chain amino acid transport system substrate-binding protein
MKRLAWAALSLAAVFAALLIALAPRDGAEPVTLGCVASLTGRLAALSASGRDGALLAVERINAKGGVAGRQLQLAVEDDAFDPAKAAEGVARLSQRGASAVAGPFASAMGAAVITEADRAGMLVISPTVSADSFSGASPFFMRIIPAVADFSGALGRHAAATRGLVTLCALVDTANAAYTTEFYRGLRQGFLQAGGKEIRAVEFDSRQGPAFQELAARALEGHPDGLAAIASPLDTAVMAQRVRQLDQAVPLFCSPWGISEDLVQSGGRAVEGMESVGPFDPVSVAQAYKDFEAAFDGRFGRQPDMAAAFYYEAVAILAASLARDPKAKGERLRGLVMAGNPHPGLQGSITFDARGDVKRPLYLLAVHNGRLTAAGAIP